MKLTQEQYEARIAKIMEQEKELGLKIELYPIDKDHLDCTWYNGDVGRITRKDGWSIVIGAHGDIRIYGKVHGEEIEFVDKGCGSAYQRLNIKDDEELRRLEDKGKITFEDNNWFEYDVLDPDGNFYDCGFIFDNVMDNNILDCFEGLGEDWFNEAIDFFKNEERE